MTFVTKARAPKKPPRVRRSPDEARELILAAARTLLAERGPDAVGLKDVARVAGVSHGLVSHYFGTYGTLVEAVMSAHQASIRAELFARMAEHPDEGPEAWIEHGFEAMAHPLYGRLSVWAVMSGRTSSAGFFARREQGLRMFVDALEQRLGPKVERERIERIVVVVLTSMLGYLMGRDVLWAALGREATVARDAAYRRELAALVAPLVASAKSTRKSPKPR